jgi:lysophospholipase L1-like esterase
LKTVVQVPNEEDAFRFYYDGEAQRLRPHFVLVDRDGRTIFEINEAGLKGDPFDARRRLAVVWGDSVVFSAGRGWPCLLDALAPGWQFLNGGIEGDPYANVLQRARELNRQRAVALNLVMLGWHPFPDNRGIRDALAAFLEETPNTVLLTIPTAINRRLVDRDLSSFLTPRDAENAFTFCGFLDYSVDMQRRGFDYLLERNAIVRDVAARMRVRCLDLHAGFDTENAEDFRRDFHDMIHLRPSAYPKIARLVHDGIADLLSPAGEAREAALSSAAAI